MPQVLAAIVAFLLTAFLGNRLLQQWQYRAWTRQQQFLSGEKEYVSLRELTEEISIQCGSRLNRARRLLSGITMGDEEFKERLKDYDAAVSDWNEKVGSFFAKLRLFATHERALALEDGVHKRFVLTGRELERLARLRKEGQSIPRRDIDRLEGRLNDVQGSIIAFDRDALNELVRIRKGVYEGYEFSYSEWNLDKMSLVELIKFLFERDIDQATISRPSGDPI